MFRISSQTVPAAQGLPDGQISGAHTILSLSSFLSALPPSMTVLDTVGGKLNSLFINLLFNSSARLCTAPSSICLFPVFKSFRIFPGVYSQCRESRFRISRRFHFPLKQFRIASSIIEISSISTFLQYVFIYVNF